MSNFFKVASQSQLPLIDGVNVRVGDLGYTLDDGGFWDAAQPSAPPGANPVWSFIDVLRGPPGSQGEVGVGLPGPQGQIGPPGLMGGRGPQGPAGRNAFSYLSLVFRVPDPSVTVPVTTSVSDTSWMTPGLLVYIPGAGTFTVVGSPPTANTVNLVNSGDPNNAAPGTMISAGTAISAANMRGPLGPQGQPGPAGPPGPQGVSGTSAFSTLAQPFSIPTTTGIAFVVDSSPFAAGQIVYVEGGEYFAVQATDDTTNTLTLVNQNYPGGQPPGTIVPIGNTVSGTGPQGPVGPQGPQGPQGTQGIQGVAMSGTIALWPTVSPPGGWLICDGTAYPKTQYSFLYSLIGDTFRNPNNTDQSSFNVPDMRGVFPIGSNSTYPLASTGGATNHALAIAELAAHTHTMGNHTHPGVNHLHPFTGVDHTHPIPTGQFTHTHSASAGTHSHTILSRSAAAPGSGASGNLINSGGPAADSTAAAGIGPITVAASALPAGGTGASDRSLASTTGAADRDLTTGAAGAGTTSSSGSGTPFSIIPPYRALNFIIKA